MQDQPADVNKDQSIQVFDSSNVPASGGYEPSVDFRSKFKSLWGSQQ
jgi:hypothetical protein